MTISKSILKDIIIFGIIVIGYLPLLYTEQTVSNMEFTYITHVTLFEWVGWIFLLVSSCLFAYFEGKRLSDDNTNLK